MAITAFLSRSSALLNWGPGGPASSETLVLIPASSLQLIWGSELQLLNRGSWGPPLLGAGFLYCILSPTDSNFLCTELYYCFMPTHFLPITGQRNVQLPPSFEWHVWSSSSGKTVIHFTDHPLPVHQFVTEPWDFNYVPYCLPSSPTQSLPITGQRNMQLPSSLEWQVWLDRRSIYNTSRVQSMDQ